MVYKCLDPAADWDAWCDDHPDPWDYYDEDDFDDEDKRSACCKAGVIPGKSQRCECCGLFCTIDLNESMENFLNRLKRESEDYY